MRSIILIWLICSSVLTPAPVPEGLRLLSARKWDKAASAFRRALSLAPEHPLARAGLIEALDRAGRTREATEEWTEARRRAGQASSELDRLRRTLDPGWPADLMPNGLALARGASVVHLLDVSLNSADEAGRWSEFYHGAALALDAQGRRTLGELQVPADARLLWAWVRLPTGETLLPELRFSDGQTRLISLYGLRDGAAIDYAWTRPARPRPGETIEFGFAAPEPLLWSRLCVAGPASILGLQRPLDLQAFALLQNDRPVRCWERRAAPAEAGAPPTIALELK